MVRTRVPRLFIRDISKGTGGLEIDSHHRMALSTTLDAVKSESIMRSAEHGSGIMVSRF